MGQQHFQALATVPVSPRTTVSGEACSLPLVVDSQLLTDCQNGTCWVVQGTGPAKQETCTAASGSSNITVAAAMAAEVGLQGQRGSLCSVEATQGLGCAASLSCKSLPGNSSSSSSSSSSSQNSSAVAAVGAAGVGFCAKAQSAHATVKDHGPACGGGCAAGIAAACVALVGALGLVGAMAYRARRRPDDYDRFSDQAGGVARNFTSQEVETPHTGTKLAQGRPSFSGRHFDSIELGSAAHAKGPGF